MGPLSCGGSASCLVHASYNWEAGRVYRSVYWRVLEGRREWERERGERWGGRSVSWLSVEHARHITGTSPCHCYGDAACCSGISLMDKQSLPMLQPRFLPQHLQHGYALFIAGPLPALSVRKWWSNTASSEVSSCGLQLDRLHCSFWNYKDSELVLGIPLIRAGKRVDYRTSNVNLRD